MSTLWHVLVVGFTVASLAALLWLLLANRRGEQGETDDHVWDDDLRENNNPLPLWWFNLFLLTLVFGVGYLALFPGLGNFAGTLGWTQEAQLGERLAPIRERRNAVFAAFGDRGVAELARDDSARALGRDVFLGNCAGCHGADARGALGFPDLADGDWLYGGAPDAIVASIAGGRTGTMPHFNGAIGAAAFDDLVVTVRRWSDSSLDAATRARGMQQFAITCAACHGADGRGNPALGSADLTDSIWLHGGSEQQVRDSILFGRTGRMPAHRELLSPDEIRAVAAWVYGLSNSLAAPGDARAPAAGG